MSSASSTRYVGTIQLGHIINALITVGPLLGVVIIGYARFTSLEEKVGAIRGDMAELRAVVDRNAARAKADIDKIMTEAAARQDVYGNRVQALERTQSVTDSRMESVLDGLREQRRTNAEISAKMDTIRSEVSQIGTRFQQLRAVR